MSAPGQSRRYRSKRSSPGAAAGINKAVVSDVAQRRALVHAWADASLHRLDANEALDIFAKLCEILGTSGRVVPLDSAIYDLLGKRRVEFARGTFGDQYEWITFRTVVLAVRAPQLALASVGAGDHEQRTARCR
jgi:hypothetical protein